MSTEVRIRMQAMRVKVLKSTHFNMENRVIFSIRRMAYALLLLHCGMQASKLAWFLRSYMKYLSPCIASAGWVAINNKSSICCVSSYVGVPKLLARPPQHLRIRRCCCLLCTVAAAFLIFN